MTITVFILRDAAANWYQMQACLAGPDLGMSEQLISLMLASMDVES